ncbi:hypothetical protein Tsubulata_047530, partial [Turnera subulata]
MEQRNMPCFSQTIDLEMVQRDQSHLHPDHCIVLGGTTNFQHVDIQTISVPGNTLNIDARHMPECYDNSSFYRMPQFHGVQCHPPHHGPNLDLGMATQSNLYVPYMTLPGISMSQASCDRLPASNNYGVAGVPADLYGRNGHLMDGTTGAYKRKNAEGNAVNFQYSNASASSSSSIVASNTSNIDRVGPTDAQSFTLPQFRVNDYPSIREAGSRRSIRNRIGANGSIPVLPHSQNQPILGNYMGQCFQPGASPWLNQQLSNTFADAGAAAWTQNPGIPYMHGNNVNGGSMESGSIHPQPYHEPASNISDESFLHPSPGNFHHQNYHQLSLPIQGIRSHSVNVNSHIPGPSFRVPTSYASQSNIVSSQDGLDIGLGHPGSVPSSGLRIYRPHLEGIIPETTPRRRNLPQLRVVPTDGIALLEFPDHYEVENYIDHHREMRLDIEDMSYEELLALGERIGSVSTGLSEEIIRSQLKIKTYISSPISINLVEEACTDQEPESCIICQV